MYYGNYGYGAGYGCCEPMCYGGGNRGGYGYALILVLFILLVIIGCTCYYPR